MKASCCWSVVVTGVACAVGVVACAAQKHDPGAILDQVAANASTLCRSAAASGPIDKIDILFMIDNSNSMAGEQASLQAQFPKLMGALTTGERFPGDPSRFRA